MKEEKEISFFKKIIISIKDFERYPELASKKWSVVLAYLLKLLAIFTIIVVFALMYTVINTNSNEVNTSKIISEKNVTTINNLKSQISQNFSQTDQIIVYLSVTVLTYIYVFIACFVAIAVDSAVNIALLGAFGYFTALILRLHLKYTAMCKIAIHSLTLPIILYAINILIQTFTTFEIKYFEAMYIGIAYIYIVTAILMIKSDIMKNQQELTKILQEQERVRQELERQKQEEENKKEEQKRKEEKESKRKKEKKQDNEKEGQDEEKNNEPQGENA